MLKKTKRLQNNTRNIWLQYYSLLSLIYQTETNENNYRPRFTDHDLHKL